MAFVKFSRDKRGYEHVYLVQPSGRRDRSAPRILYWFRTPPNLKVGREPFDESVRRALEAQNRDVVFNWPRLLATPMPPPDTERWRERRRAERAARRAADADSEVNPNAANAVEGSSAEEAPNPQDAGSREYPAHTADGEGQQTAGGGAQTVGTNESGRVEPSAGPSRRRRRRRRRRRGPGGEGVAPAVPSEAAANFPNPGVTEDGH